MNIPKLRLTPGTVVCIYGPTHTGKTELIEEIASRYHITNFDDFCDGIVSGRKLAAGEILKRVRRGEIIVVGITLSNDVSSSFHLTQGNKAFVDVMIRTEKDKEPKVMWRSKP